MISTKKSHAVAWLFFVLSYMGFILDIVCGIYAVDAFFGQADLATTLYVLERLEAEYKSNKNCD